MQDAAEFFVNDLLNVWADLVPFRLGCSAVEEGDEDSRAPDLPFIPSVDPPPSGGTAPATRTF